MTRRRPPPGGWCAGFETPSTSHADLRGRHRDARDDGTARDAAAVARDAGMEVERRARTPRARALAQKASGARPRPRRRDDGEWINGRRLESVDVGVDD